MENGIKNEEKTAISNSTVIIGDITAKEHLIINGTVKGNIQINKYNLFIGPRGVSSLHRSYCIGSCNI